MQAHTGDRVRPDVWGPENSTTPVGREEGWLWAGTSSLDLGGSMERRKDSQAATEARTVPTVRRPWHAIRTGLSELSRVPVVYSDPSIMNSHQLSLPMEKQSGYYLLCFVFLNLL